MAQILIIDDDPTMRMTLSRSLKKQGYEVSVASDGAEGLREAQRLHPSLIICDWMMSLMDGLEVCRSIKATDELANTYFILLTARDQVGDIVQGLESGADDFLSKPPDMNELRARIRAGLRLHQANRDLQIQKQRLEAELAQASEYVRSLLPQNLEDEVTTQSCFLSSAQLGGDCFDFYWLDSENFVVYLLDVSGHGVGSALLSVSVLNVLRSQGLRSQSELISTMDFRQPSVVLHVLNNTFQMSNHKDMYFTIWYGVYNKSKRQLTYSSGGHPPAILINPNSSEHPAQVKRLKTGGLPVGMIPNAIYEEACCDIPPSSILYLFSDGAYEITQPDDTIWGIDALSDVLTNNCREKKASRLEQVLSHVITAGKLGSNFEDDLSLLEVQFR